MRSSFRLWPSHLRWIALVALLIGVAERVGWAFARKNGSATGEAFNVAVAIARGRGFADAFAEGQGPTAHLLPIPPSVAGGIYTLFGIQSDASESVLLLLALGLTFGCYILLFGFFRQIGASLAACVSGFSFLCIAPIYTGMEVFDFRVWEGAMSIFAAAVLLRLLVSPNSSPSRSAAIAALPAIILFLNPIIGIAACCAITLFLSRQASGRSSAVAIFALTFILLFGTWTIRNMMVMGEPIWLRDNLGLELAVSNHPGAVAADDPKAAFDARIEQIHPFASEAAYRALHASGGEVAYARQIGQETVAWMKAHPGDVAAIWLGHLRELTIPPPWTFQTAHGKALPIIRSILIDLVHLFGFAGLVLMWRRNRCGTAYLLPFVLLPILAYIPFQPITRYTWLFYIPLAYAAAIAIEAAAQRVMEGRRYSTVTDFARLRG